jgi:transposase
VVGVPAALPPLEVSAEERTQLGRLVRASSTPQQMALRAQIVLAAGDGEPSRRIASRLGVSEPTVKLWRRSFADRGLDGLADRPRSGRPRRYDDDQIARVVAKTLEPPPQGETHWSVRRLAEATGLSHATVHRIWREHKLRPHQTRSFKYSTDIELEAKVIDLVGLYLAPPAGAFVLCVDEKTQIQALDRTQPTLPIKPGKAARMTHDYKRNGTTSLYAALEVATGHITGTCQPRHTHREFLAFLNTLVRAYPRRPLHVVLDNSSTHTTPEINTWLARHPRVQFHFTPKGASWMNLVEAWFSILTRQQLRRGVYHDVTALITAITSFITSYNTRAQPFAWTKNADQILAKARPHTQDTSETEH